MCHWNYLPLDNVLSSSIFRTSRTVKQINVIENKSLKYTYTYSEFEWDSINVEALALRLNRANVGSGNRDFMIYKNDSIYFQPFFLMFFFWLFNMYECNLEKSKNLNIISYTEMQLFFIDDWFMKRCIQWSAGVCANADMYLSGF